MKIREDFILRKIADTYVVVPVGQAVVDFSGLINLNETGALLFKTLQQGSSENQLVDVLLQQYDVSREIAQKDVQNFISEVKDANILE